MFNFFSTVIVVILLNNNNTAYFWHNVFNKLNQTFILTGCREDLLKVCVYDMTLVLLKWNGKMLVKWLSGQFWRCCSCIYVLIETADERHARCVYNVSKQNRVSAPFTQRRAEHAGFIFKSTFAA